MNERHEEIRRELRKLYERSARATHPAVIKRYEAWISVLESEAATIKH